MKKYFFQSLVLLFFLLVFFVINLSVFIRFLSILTLSYIAVLLMQPVYRFFLKHFHSKGLSAFLSYVLLLFLIILPLTLVVLMIVNEVSNITNNIQFSSFMDNFSQLQLWINNLIKSINDVILGFNLDFQLSYIDFSSFFSSINSSDFLQDGVLPVFRNIATFSGEFIFGFFIFTLCTLFLFPIWQNLPDYLSRISPLSKEYDLRLISKVNSTIKGVVIGSFGVAILQASAVIIPLLVFNVGAPFLLWVIMIILSVIPIGSGLVWAPIGVAFIVNGISASNISSVFLGIFLLIYSAIVINIIDAYFRPKFMSSSLGLHPLVFILSVIGGIGTFGILGIVYGPVCVVVLTTLIEIYREEFQSYEK